MGTKGDFKEIQLQNSDQKLANVASNPLNPKIPGELLLYAVPRRIDSLDLEQGKRATDLIEKDEAMIKALEAIVSRK